MRHLHRGCVGCEETAPSGASEGENSHEKRWGNRSRRERRIGAVTAFEWSLSATRRRDEVSSAVTVASAATAAPTRPRLRWLPRRPVTAKPAVATRAVISMATATMVTSAGAVHRVVHDDRRSRRRVHAQRGARRTTGRTIASPIAVFVVAITSAIMIAGGADGGSAQRERIGASGSERTGDRRAQRAGARAKRQARARTGVAAARCAHAKTGRATAEAMTRPAMRCGQAAQRATGMPSCRARSTRFSVMPDPGKAMTPLGRRFSSSSLRRNGAARP